MNYYNEHDPKAASRLRELIAAGMIPDGVVDERSITEIKPHELTEFTQCHFFAGISGWSLALELAGWPSTRPVWTGSCPCQPFSSAGKQDGHCDERHLWPVFFKLIEACRPPVIFGEQVASSLVIGKAGGKADADAPPVWLDGVQTDLEAAHYAFGAVVMAAAGVGAPHIRSRTYWVASDRLADAAGGQYQQRLRPQRDELQRSPDDGADGGLADADKLDGDGAGHGAGHDGGERQGSEELRGERGVCGMADAVCGGERGRDERGSGASGREVGEQENREGFADQSGDGCEDALRLADAEHAERRTLSEHRKDGHHGEDDGRTKAHRELGTCGEVCHGLGDPTGGGCGELRDEAQPRRSGHSVGASWSRFEIVHCRDGKARRFERQSQPLADGVPALLDALRDAGASESQIQAALETFPLAQNQPGRVSLLRGFGNAIVPEAAAEFISAFLEISKQQP